jgi:OmpA family
MPLGVISTYNHSSDMRTIATTLFLVAISMMLVAQPTTANVHFANASAVLDEETLAQLDALCITTHARTPVAVTFTGHTDANGSNAYNADLSQRRVQAVRSALAERCPTLANAQLHWCGEEAPIADNTTDPGRAHNRRVEITIHYAEQAATACPYAPDQHRHPLVIPLFPEADKTREHFRKDPTLPIEFVAKDGVRVRIAPDAMVDAMGTPVHGLVDITYRSFYEPWEVIASGIPMHVGGPDAGHMESAGMFEVYASQNGNPLSLKPGESISLSPAQPIQLEIGYRNWTLSSTNGTWVERMDKNSMEPKGVVLMPSPEETVSYRSNAMMAYASSNTESTTASPGTTEAVRRYMKKFSDLPAMPDTTHFLTRLESDAYCHTTECSATTKPYVRYKGRYMTPYSDADIPSIQVVIDQVNFRGRRETAFRVVLQRKNLHTDWQAFPEKRMWVYKGSLSRKELRKRIATRHFYQDVFLDAEKGANNGMVRLKDRGEWIELPVDLTYYQRTNKDQLAWEDELVDYNGRFNAKRKRFDKKLDERVTTTVERIKNGKRNAWKNARPVMTDAELAMNEQEWHEYAQRTFNLDLWASVRNAQSAASGFTQALAMRGFGIFNCDRILDRSAIEPAAVAVKDSDGANFPWSMAYGVIAGKKAVITYWGTNSGEDHMRLSRDMSSILFVTGDGRLLLVERPGDVARGAKLILKGKQCDAPKSAEDLQTFTRR